MHRTRSLLFRCFPLALSPVRTREMKITPISPRCKSSRWVSRYRFIARRFNVYGGGRASRVVAIETYADIKKTNTRDGATISTVYLRRTFGLDVYEVCQCYSRERERARKRRAHGRLRWESPLLDPFTIMHPHVTWSFAWRPDFSAGPRISDGSPRIIASDEEGARNVIAVTQIKQSRRFFFPRESRSRFVWLPFPFLANASCSVRVSVSVCLLLVLSHISV